MNPAEREELAGLLPSPGDPVLPSDRLNQLEAHIMREITAGAPVASARPAGEGRSPFRRFAAIAVPVGVAAAVGATLLTVGSGGTGGPSTDPEAVRLLNRIAKVAAAQDAPQVRDDQYVYTLVQGTEQITDKGQDTFRRSDWHAVDGKRDGLARITVLSGPSGKGTTDMKLNADPNATTYRELEALPTDTEALHDHVWSATEGQGPTHEEAALEMIGSMLESAALLPEVEAALYRAAARIPGVTVVDHAEDAAGRAGVGLAFGDGEERDVWVFGEKDLNYLGSEEVALLDVDVVDEAGQIPAG
ncbi:CU044_5270 family protein [Streptomyces sp. TRM 70361]|uniref:CU044_5270 family protein n=1 Tax=Streptomyces sp. TRM 70361 TaxID=3116553 RepID=UPI002E7C4870|nr:CU044_5270 family protein [Streptomyces sp. TRM 70361]MEE1938048.1 CU044_5270 family protein [Streptomyces sp. TRM 70361]